MTFLQMIIAMETGHIPPNINFKEPRSDVEVLHTGRIKVVTEKQTHNGLMGKLTHDYMTL